MVELKNKQTGQAVGEISEADLQFLQDQMEEDREGDNDYYINEDELANFEESGASASMIALLRSALDENGELEIEWEYEL
jgi:hypothetical protein